MLKPREPDDLFNQSTMTFGEHLEELRAALLRAVFGLAIGAAIGLFWLGNHVMVWIQKPLVEAMERFYVKQAASEEYFARMADELKELGLPVPDDYKHLSTVAAEEKMLYEVRLFEVAAMRQTLGLPVEEGAGPSPDSGDQRPADTVGSATPPSAEKLAPLILWTPVKHDSRVSMKVFNAVEAFTIWLKASLLAGFVISSPWVFYQLWIFVAAGLYPHERHYVYVFLPFSLGLFFAGVATAYFAVFSPVLDFLLGFGLHFGLEPEPRISEWLSFVLLLPIGFGLGFQLPLVMLFLERIGIFDLPTYVRKWRIAVLVIFVAAAILTPADPYSMLLMALPMTLLYGVGLLLCRFFPRSVAASA